MKRTSRDQSNLSESLHHRLNSYALAAGAAGVGVLVLGQPVEAKIIYTKADCMVEGHHRACLLNLDHHGKADFSIQLRIYHSTGPRVDRLMAVPDQPSNAVNLMHNTQNDRSLALVLGQGEMISSGNRFPAGVNATMVSGSAKETSDFGYWQNVADGYLGLRFQIRGRTHYAWARLSTYSRGAAISATLTGYAYETIPNKPIEAGQTKESDVITVEPGSLGHMARGAANRQ